MTVSTAEPPPLGDLPERFGLAPATVEGLNCFAMLLAGDPEAPTTVRSLPAIRDDHLADALVALDIPAVRAAAAIADVGSGAGVPGLPLALALPNARVTLVESNHRKCAFLRRAIEACGISNADVVAERAEAWTAGIGSCDLVTVRAVAPLAVVAEYAAPLLRLGGTLVAWRGRREPEVEREAADAAEILGFCVHEPRRVEPFSAAEHRYLHVMSKVRETPARFPRRPGVARKRPLGAAARGSDRP